MFLAGGALALLAAILQVIDTGKYGQPAVNLLQAGADRLAGGSVRLAVVHSLLEVLGELLAALYVVATPGLERCAGLDVDLGRSELVRLKALPL